MAVHAEPQRPRKAVTYRSHGVHEGEEFDPDETLRRLGKRALGHLSQYPHHAVTCAELRIALAAGVGMVPALRAAVTAMAPYTGARELVEDVVAVMRRL